MCFFSGHDGKSAREHFASYIPHGVVLTPDLLLTRGLSGIVFWFVEKCRNWWVHKFHLVAEQSVADCGIGHECGSVESLGRVYEVTQRCKPASAWKEAARMVELEREKNQLEDDLLTFLGKVDRMQKKIDEMTLNENHDAELIAKAMKERDRGRARATLGGEQKAEATSR